MAILLFSPRRSPLEAGASVTVTILLKVDEGFDGTEIINSAGIIPFSMIPDWTI